MKSILKSLLVLGLAAGISTASLTTEAEARRGARVAAGVAAGIIGLGILGAYASRPAYAYSGPACHWRERCGYVGRSCWENRWGEVRCGPAKHRCWSEQVCY
jgi:hypothetical protein